MIKNFIPNPPLDNKSKIMREAMANEIRKVTDLEACDAELLKMVRQHPDIVRETAKCFEGWLYLIENHSDDVDIPSIVINSQNYLLTLRTIVTRNRANDTLAEIENEERNNS